MKFLMLIMVTLVVGCEPVRTAGTHGLPPESLAILHVTSEYDFRQVHLTAIQFDGGDKYVIDGDRDFYLTAGVHKVAIDLAASFDGPMKWFAPGDMKIDGPQNLVTGNLKRGKTYELTGFAGAMEGIFSDENITITREMATK